MSEEVAKEGSFLRLLIQSRPKLQKIILVEANDKQTEVIVEVLLNSVALSSVRKCRKFKTIFDFIHRKRFKTSIARKFFSKNSEIVVKLIQAVLSALPDNQLSDILACDYDS